MLNTQKKSIAKCYSVGRQEVFHLDVVISVLGFITRRVSAEEGWSVRKTPQEGDIGSRKALGFLSLTQHVTF